MIKSKKKKRILIFLLIMLFITVFYNLCFLYYFVDYYEKNKLYIHLKDNLTVEINSKITLNDFVKEIKNGNILNGQEEIDTSKLGNKNLTLKVKNKKSKEKEFHFLVKVIDTTKPVIDAKSEITSYVGRNINLLDYVKVSDNSQEEIKPKIIGEYNLNKAGKYKLKYIASDSSNNQVEFDFILNIISNNSNRTFTTSKGFSGKIINGITYIDGIIIVNKTYSLPSTYGNGITKETQNAFNKMKEDASKLGLNLWIASGYRSYSLQKSIYNNYVGIDGQKAADTYSARAGHSEHQSGLAFDLNTISDSFAFTNEGKWVNDNCYKYGLIIRYPKGKDNITGYMYEPWHLRYVGVELATKLYNNGSWSTVEEYFGIDSKYQ